jgi:hypothetical protein
MFALVLATVALAAYFGYITGVRRERGRREQLASLEAERNPPERRGVRLHVLKIRR